MIRLALLTGLLVSVPAAAAQGPTLDQLLASPSAAEIAARWKSLCVDFAGDTKAQKAAVKAQGIDWPYQAMFLKDEGQPACVIASSTDTSTDIAALSGAINATLSPLALSDVTPKGESVTARLSVNGTQYKVSAGLQHAPGNLIAVLSLAPLGKAEK